MHKWYQVGEIIGILCKDGNHVTKRVAEIPKLGNIVQRWKCYQAETPKLWECYQAGAQRKLRNVVHRWVPSGCPVEIQNSEIVGILCKDGNHVTKRVAEILKLGNIVQRWKCYQAETLKLWECYQAGAQWKLRNVVHRWECYQVGALRKFRQCCDL